MGPEGKLAIDSKPGQAGTFTIRLFRLRDGPSMDPC